MSEKKQKGYPQEIYKKILKILRQRYGNKVKTNTQLDKIGDEYFGGVYNGTYSWDKYPIDKLPEYSFAIINTDKSDQGGEHWVAIHKYKNKIYVYDSFGRHTKNLLKNFNKMVKGAGCDVIDAEYDAEQNDNQEDCGIRCIAFLLIVKAMGIKSALTI